MPNGWVHEIGNQRSLGTTFVGSCGVHTSDTSAATTRIADERRADAPRPRPPDVLHADDPQPGVDQPVEDVDDEPDDEHDDGDQQHRPLHLLQVAHADVADEHLSDTRQVEHPLDHDDAGDEAGDLHAEDGDDRDRGVAQTVAVQRLCPRQALGPRRADVVLVQHVERRRADEPQQHGALRQRQRDRRQDERPAASAGSSQPWRGKPLGGSRFQLTAKATIRISPAQNEGTAMPSWLATEMPTPSARRWRAPATMPSGTATTIDSTVDASTSGALTVSFCPSWLVTVSPFSGRRAEVAAQDAADPVEVLHDERPVEAELLADRGDLLGRRLRAADHRAQVARQQAQQQEDDDAGDEEGEQQQAQPPQQRRASWSTISR